MNLADGVDVWVDEIGSEPRRAGFLRPSFQGARNLASTSFQYDADFLASPDRYALSPDLPLVSARQFSPESRVLFGAFDDATPDEWGRRIIDANHAATLAERPDLPRRLGAFDHLLGVSDRTRAGALRLRSRDGRAWLSDDAGVADIHDLDHVLRVARRYEADEATDADLAYLNDVATSPGGARPKANVVTADGRLAIAKLPLSRDGSTDVEGWEALALTIARRSGIRTSDWQRRVAGPTTSVLLVYRFDRGPAERRLGYLSGASALELGPYDDRTVTYEHFTDAIAETSARPESDLREMFARIALTVLINNVDDHWRNHGFLHDATGWRLAPAFDLNPSTSRGVISSRPISDQDDPRNRDLRHLVDVAASFRLAPAAARAIIRRVADEVMNWPQVADALGIAKSEQTAMASAFSVEQLDYAMSLSD